MTISTAAALGRSRPCALPAALTWGRCPAPGPSADQPPLDLDLGPAPGADPGVPVVAGVRSAVVGDGWSITPRPELPPVTAWAARLALAIVHVLHGHRPVSQLNRWVVEDVLVALTVLQRRRLRRPARPGAVMGPTLVSVRVQHPSADVAEVSAHLVVDRRGAAMALRLEARGDRWLCTAVELGPRASSTEDAA